MKRPYFLAPQLMYINRIKLNNIPEMLRLITDFDGPIIDVSERYYRVYQYCLEQTKSPTQSVNRLTKDEFWQLKRSQVPERQIGTISGLNPERAAAFARLRKETVHGMSYLKYDRPVEGAIASLARIEELGFDLVVMTMRREREFNAAIEKYDLGRFFPTARRYHLSDDYLKTKDIEDKPKLMARALQELPPAADIWMVGDTEADLIAAKIHQIKAIGVLSGIRNRSRLEIHQPDAIVNNLAEAVETILDDLAPIKSSVENN
jgi:phosphoglycolate phosphatase-like HAD superfamily hydrolase